MTKVEFLGARLEESIFKMVEETAKEESVDKTKALRDLIVLGRKQFLLNKYLELYRQGRCSLDKAAEAVGITVCEMMQKAASEGVKSDETIEEYKNGLRILEKST